jgi:hypothetical protein
VDWKRHNPLCLRVLVAHQKKIYFPLDRASFVWYTSLGGWHAPCGNRRQVKNEKRKTKIRRFLVPWCLRV